MAPALLCSGIGHAPPEIYWDSGIEVVPMLQSTPHYACETHTVSIGGRTVTIQNKTPELADGERGELFREIESDLFRIFVKYGDSPFCAAGE